MVKKEQIQEVGKSVWIGVILFFSAVLFLMQSGDINHLKLFSDNLLWIIGAYIFGTIAVRFLFSLEICRKGAFLFQGEAIIWWVFLVFTVLSVILPFIPEYMRDIMLVNIFVLILMMLGNYLHMRYISKELNGGAWQKDFVLIEDLKRKPRNEEEFIKFIILYCEKNALELEILQYGEPAKVKMGGRVYTVKIVEYCSLSNGVAYAMEFRCV